MANKDGKIVVCSHELKALRRRHGLSQELLAMQCAEQGLSVSIASIKRAETGKNILYRTARDIARFFQVQIDDLLPHESSTTSSDTDKSVLSKIPVSQQSEARNIIIIACSLMNYEEFITSFDEESQTQFFEIANTHIEYFGGISYQRSGDSLIGIFGLPIAYGNDTERCLHSALQIQKDLKDTFHSQAVFNIGISSGQAVSTEKASLYVAINGIDTPLHYTITPTSITSVMMLNKMSQPGQILVTDSIKYSIQHKFTCESKPSKDPLDSIWKITGKLKQQAPLLPLLVGRQVELQHFQSTLESCVTYSQGQLIYLRGVAGIGKTRLLEEFGQLASIPVIFESA